MSISLALVIAAAAPFADLDAVDRQVAQFTGAEIGQPGGAMSGVDRRLRLNACASSLGLSWRTQQRGNRREHDLERGRLCGRGAQDQMHTVHLGPEHGGD